MDDKNNWRYCEEHNQICQIIETQNIWGESICRVWLPSQDSVVRVRASSLKPLGVTNLINHSISYIVAAAKVADALTQDVLLAPIESSVIPLPHQIKALSRATSKDRIRYLLADEVGLGKTIEAGLIMRELKLRGLGGDGPQKVEFAAFGEEIAVFQWGSDEEVLFGCYGPADEELKCQLANMAAVGAQEGSALLYLHAVWLFCVVAGLLVGVLWWRRAEAFIEQIPLPDAVRVAPLWRRGLAFLIDSVPTMLITVALMPGLGKELAEQGATLQQIQSEYVLLMSLRLTVVWLPVLILYYSIGEGLRGMTPGKMALGLVVISYDARGLTVGQALLRNIMRLLELFPQMFPFVILLTLFTRRVQRPGDLLARTIVVLDTPELRNHLRDAARGES